MGCPYAKSWTEHAQDNAHSGQKSDDFGSRTDAKAWNHAAVRLKRAMGLMGADVCSVPGEASAVERARWLAELSDALDGAARVLVALELSAEQLNAARDLYLRIEAARIEVQALRLSRSLRPREDNDPKRIELSSPMFGL